MPEKNDEQLIVDCLKGGEESLEVLVRRYLKPIYGFVYRFVGNADDAEDVTQEVFVKTWQNLKKFKRDKNFKTWVFSIARNAALDFLRKKKAAPFSDFPDFEIEGIADSMPLPQDVFERTDTAQVLASVVEKLPPPYRAVLILRYNDHFTFKEMSESLGEPLHTVKSRHRRALILLKKLLVE